MGGVVVQECKEAGCGTCVSDTSTAETDPELNV